MYTCTWQSGGSDDGHEVLVWVFAAVAIHRSYSYEGPHQNAEMHGARRPGVVRHARLAHYELHGARRA